MSRTASVCLGLNLETWLFALQLPVSLQPPQGMADEMKEAEATAALKGLCLDDTDGGVRVDVE